MNFRSEDSQNFFELLLISSKEFRGENLEKVEILARIIEVQSVADSRSRYVNFVPHCMLYGDFVTLDAFAIFFAPPNERRGWVRYGVSAL